MAQYIEFKIVNEKFMKMGGGDPLKAMEERTAALREIAEKAEKGQYTYSDDWNPFPKWLQSIIKSMAETHRSKAKFDNENSIFRIKMGGDRSDYDDFYDEFKKKFSEASALPENQEWIKDNRVHITATEDDEVGAMNDLELYQRNSAALPPSRTPQGESK